MLSIHVCSICVESCIYIYIRFNYHFTSLQLPLTAVGSNPDSDFGFFHVRKLSLKLMECEGSTQVSVRAWNNAQKGTWGLPPPVKLERRDMTYTVSMWHKPKTNKQTKPHYREHWSVGKRNLSVIIINDMTVNLKGICLLLLIRNHVGYKVELLRN
jgi:hypothetical protein